MNPRTMIHPNVDSKRAYNAATGNQAPALAPPGDLRNLCALQVAQAVEFEKATLASAVCMNSCLMNMCKHACWFPLGIGNFFEAESQTLARCMDLEMRWLGLSALGTEMVHAAPTEEEMDRSWDIAVAAFENEILA